MNRFRVIRIKKILFTNLCLRILGLASLLIVFGCSTTPTLKTFRKIKKGMPKYEVLEILGAPRQVRRVRNQDRYTYTFSSDDDLIEKEIHFEDTRVVYIGDPMGKSNKSLPNEDTVPVPNSNTQTQPLAGEVELDNSNSEELQNSSPANSNTEEELSQPTEEPQKAKPKPDYMEEMEQSLKPKKNKARPRIKQKSS